MIILLTDGDIFILSLVLFTVCSCGDGGTITLCIHTADNWTLDPVPHIFSHHCMDNI